MRPKGVADAHTVSVATERFKQGDTFEMFERAVGCPSKGTED